MPLRSTGDDDAWLQVQLPGRPGQTALIERCQRRAVAAAGMVQCIGEIETIALSSEGLLDLDMIFKVDVRHRQQDGHHLAHLLAAKSVVAPEHPFEFKNHCFGTNSASPDSIRR